MRLAKPILLYLASPTLVAAQCVEFGPERYRIEAEVTSCSELGVIGPASDAYLKLSVGSAISVTPVCQNASCQLGKVSDYYRRDLTQQKHFFLKVPMGSSCQLVKGKSVALEPIQQCCDTFPHSGTCAFDAPMVKFWEK